MVRFTKLKGSDTMQKYQQDFLESRYGFNVDDGIVNWQKFINDLPLSKAYAEAFNVPIPNISRFKVSRLNPNYKEELENHIKNRYKNNRKPKKNSKSPIMSIKKMAELGFIMCESCKSIKWLIEQQVIICEKCHIVELKKHIIVGKSKRVKFRTKNYQYGKRSRLFYDALKPYCNSKTIRRKTESLSLKHEELGLIRLNKRKYSTRVYQIQAYDMGILSNPLKDTKHSETLNTNRAEYRQKSDYYNRGISNPIMHYIEPKRKKKGGNKEE